MLGSIQGRVYLHARPYSRRYDLCYWRCCLCGDTLFMPDYGTARCDFPRLWWKTLYESAQKSLPCRSPPVFYVSRLFASGVARTLFWETTVGEEKKKISILAVLLEKAKQSLCKCEQHVTPLWECLI